MDFIEQLARTCLMVKGADVVDAGTPSAPAVDPMKVRTKFEHLADKEKLLRRHAERWNQLAEERSLDNDTSFGGYVGDAAARVLPIPHSGSEALIRGGGILAGGLAGYHLGKGFDLPDGQALKQVFAPVGGKGGKGGPTPGGSSPIAQQLRLMGDMNFKDPKRLNLALDQLRIAAPDALAGALQANTTPVPFFRKALTPQQQALRSLIEQDIAPVDQVMTEVKNIQAQGKKPEKGVVGQAASVLPKSPKGWRGALVGAGGAAALTAIPYVINSILAKRHGGEAAVRARAEAQARLDAANAAADERETVLQEAGV